MRNTKEIIQALKLATEWSQPNIKYNEIMALINELETVLEKQSTPAPAPKVETKPKTQPKPKTTTKK